ncbi:hypothetical protein B9Z19DRAFT_1122912 [Tuber borchii]|uniref:Uncharacterized protein n=1 Tax=Tuber borchii TaxID=42251 RepID=A0A2T6ZZF4_TUBBO|nr:hypothetical protein B9Z19DRAFT_1122912 [Tuber borchii]
MSPLQSGQENFLMTEVQSALLKRPPKAITEPEPILSGLQRMGQTAKDIAKEANRLWSAIAIKCAWEIGLEKYTFPEKLSFLVMEKHSPPTPCIGFVLELGLVAKMCFAGKRDGDNVQASGVVGVPIRDVKLTERHFWFEFTGAVEVPAAKV